MQNKKKLVLIGWDAADWKVIHPLLDSGMMPALESLINNGVMGNIATLDPPLSPMLWTSIATGKHADKHGILGFIEPTPDGLGITPCLVTSRKVKAIWNMLMQSGYKSNVVGWWPSHPAEPINGISISNFYKKPNEDNNQEWPIAAGTVHPVSKEKIFKNLRIHPDELTEAHLIPFLPDGAIVNQENYKKLEAILKITAQCSSIHAAATYILEYEEWDFLAVYYDAIDHYCHGFMEYYPPKLSYVDQGMFDLYKDVVKGAYIFHDMMLARILELVDEDTTIMLVSDHGFHSDHLRLQGLPDEPAAPAWEHREYGIFVAKGPGIKKDDTVFGANLSDVTPTILAALGLPIGQDMDGKPLLQIFENTPNPLYIKSWEEIDGWCGMHTKEMMRDPIAEQTALDQLIELGYIEKPDDDSEKQIEKTVNESKFYLARVLMNKGKFSEALPLLEELYNKDNNVIRFAFQYAKCLSSVMQIDEAIIVVEKLINYEESKPDDNSKENTLEENKAENKTKAKNNVKKREYPELYLLKGTLEISKKNYEEALHFLKLAEKSDPRLPQLHQQIAFAYLKMRRVADAENAVLQALEVDPESAIANYIMSEIKMRHKDFESAAEYALFAVGLRYNYPAAHYNLGVALTKLGLFDRAVEALQVAVKMAPGFIKAYKFLSYIYLVHLRDYEKTDFYNAKIKELQITK